MQQKNKSIYFRIFYSGGINDPTFVEVTCENINARKMEIYREYIELGKQEKVIDNTIPTEILLDFMEVINMIGSKLTVDDDMSEKVKHIHHLFLYGIIGR